MKCHNAAVERAQKWWGQFAMVIIIARNEMQVHEVSTGQSSNSACHVRLAEPLDKPCHAGVPVHLQR
jgi:hypothetical protein